MRLTIHYIFVAMLLLLFGTSAAQSSDRPADLVYGALKALQPALTERQAKKLAAAFVQASNEETCDIPWQILVSIAYNESSLGLKMVNPKTQDYGLMQINNRTLSRLGLNKKKVMSDHLYSIRAACKVLRHNRDTYGDRYYWVGIYRSGNAFWRQKIIDNAIRYHNIIMRTADSIGYVDSAEYAQAD